MPKVTSSSPATAAPAAATAATPAAETPAYKPKTAQEASALESPIYSAYRQKLRDRGYFELDNAPTPAV